MKTQTNPRYRHFTQSHFTAGDTEQFFSYVFNHVSENTKKNRVEPIQKLKIGAIYKDLTFFDVKNTFKYLFYKFKKAIYVSIRDNKLEIFLPFSNVNYVNEWSDDVVCDEYIIEYINNKYSKETRRLSDIHKILWFCQKNENRAFNPKRVHAFNNKWYSNNCLIRYEHPIPEGDSGTHQMYDMFQTLCDCRDVPDVDFFINRRDFPLLRKGGKEAYDCVFGEDTPLLSHHYKKMCPILSMTGNNKFHDILIPTWEDWNRVSGKTFPKVKHQYKDQFVEWKDKKNIAVFRGASTGKYAEKNLRIELCKMTNEYIDAGITHFNLRPRINYIHNKPTLTCINKELLNISKKPFLTPFQQSQYKYIIHVAGHTAAYRLSYELGMGSVILFVEGEYQLWYQSKLIEFNYKNSDKAHYILIKRDLSNLVKVIEYCREHDNECQQIATNAKRFYDAYLGKENVLDSVRDILWNVSNWTGFIRHYPNCFDRQVSQERKMLCFDGKVNVDGYRKSERRWSNIYKKGLSIVKEMKGKKQEFIHHIFVNKNIINPIAEFLPNFVKMTNYNQQYIVMQNIYPNMICFMDWLKSSQFTCKDYISILIQLNIVLDYMQHSCGFVHYDLTPWNVMLQRTDSEITIDYKESGKIKTTLIPVIIDYGKSTVVYKDVYYSFTNKYYTDTIHDCLSILITSMSMIHHKHLAYLSGLLSFVSNTSYANNKPLTTMRSIKSFLYNKKKYDSLMTSEKGELQKKTSIDFVNHIVSNYKTDIIVENPVTRSIKNRYTLSEDDIYKGCVKTYKKMNKWEKASYDTWLDQTQYFMSGIAATEL